MAEAPPEQGRGGPMGFAWRLALFYGAIFLLIGVFLPYFPVWLDWRGLDADQIAIVLAAPLFVRILFTPAVSFAADRLADRRATLRALAWGAALSVLLFQFASDFWGVLAVALLFALAWTSIMPLTEAVAMAGVRSAGLDYGRMRLWGSLTFIAATFAGGVALDLWGPRAALWLLMAAAFAVLAAAHLLPRPTGHGRLEAATAPPPIRLKDALALARAPLFWLLLVTTGAVQGAHAVYYAFGTLHWQSLGISSATIGALWATGVVAEIVLFWVSGRALAVFGITGLIWLAGLAAIVRWTATALDPPLWLLFPIQTLHGLTFGAAHLGAIHFISAAVPERAAATAQGLYAAVTAGILMGSATLAAGPLYAALGANAYLAMAALAAVSACGGWALHRTWRGAALLPR